MKVHPRDIERPSRGSIAALQRIGSATTVGSGVSGEARAEYTAWRAAQGG